MKARFCTAFSLALALAALPFMAGCTEEAEGVPQTASDPTNTAPASATITSNAPAEFSPPAEAEIEPMPDVNPDEIIPAPAPADAPEKKQLPANLKPTPPTAEMIKLAQAGVDEAVMLNYVTNTPSLFHLSSDDIIYLSDLGVAGDIVTAMLQHDQALKTAAAIPASPPPQEVAQAAAPAYVNPPKTVPHPQTDPPPAESAPPPTVVVNDYGSYFNDSLAPYGTWVSVPGYGRCWQPTVVVANPGWRPYCDRGRWVYSDCGWYWLSDYSWGATTFHYGRWFCHPHWGWCWWPDTVWAPAWVSWRYSSAYCGWAALPPAACYRPGFGFSYYGSSVGVNFSFGLGASSFTFVSWNHVNDSHPWNHRVDSHHAKAIYHDTTVANNYGTGKDNLVIHRGIPASQVREFAGKDLRAVHVRDLKETPDAPRVVRAEHLERDGRTLTVQRRQFPEGAVGRSLSPSRPFTETARESGAPPTANTGATPPKILRPSTMASTTPETIGRSEIEVNRGYGRRLVPATQSPNGVTTPTYNAPKPTTPNSQPTANPRAGPGAPSKSLIVVGRRDGNLERNTSGDIERRGPVTHSEAPNRGESPRTTQNWSGQKAPSPTQQQFVGPQRNQAAPTPSYPRPETQQRVVQPENRYSSQPTYGPPRQSANAPVYAAPPRQMAPAPAPTTTPAPRVAPSAPQAAPAPAQSQNSGSSTRSAPERSSGGGGNRRSN